MYVTCMDVDKYYVKRNRIERHGLCDQCGSAFDAEPQMKALFGIVRYFGQLYLKLHRASEEEDYINQRRDHKGYLRVKPQGRYLVLSVRLDCGCRQSKPGTAGLFRVLFLFLSTRSLTLLLDLPRFWSEPLLLTLEFVLFDPRSNEPRRPLVSATVLEKC